MSDVTAYQFVKQVTRISTGLSFILTAALLAAQPGHTQSANDDLKVYAVAVLNVAPFARPYSGFGIYLGDNAIITAAHVVGHWPLFSNASVLIADREISAKVIKKGSFPRLDLALLVVADSALPVSLRLRHDPLCKTPLSAGTNVVIVYPDRTKQSQVVSKTMIESKYRDQFGTLVSEPEGSGSGVFDPDRECLLGIMSAAVTTQYDFRAALPPQFRFQPLNRSVGYFVPASVIANFIPVHLRF